MAKRTEKRKLRAENCWFCGGKIKPSIIVVRDHGQLIGKNGGAAYQSCKLNVEKSHSSSYVRFLSKNFNCCWFPFDYQILN